MYTRSMSLLRLPSQHKEVYVMGSDIVPKTKLFCCLRGSLTKSKNHPSLENNLFGMPLCSENNCFGSSRTQPIITEETYK